MVFLSRGRDYLPLSFCRCWRKRRKNIEKLAIQNLSTLCKTYVNNAALRIATVFNRCKQLIKKVLICQLYLSEGVTIWRAVSSIRFYPAIPKAATLCCY